MATANTVLQKYNQRQSSTVLSPNTSTLLPNVIPTLSQLQAGHLPVLSQTCRGCPKPLGHPMATICNSTQNSETLSHVLISLVHHVIGWLIHLIDHLMIDSPLPQPCSLFIWVGVEPKCRVRSLSRPGLTSAQLNMLMTQLMVFHTRRPSVQCGPCSFACGRCRALNFTVCYIQMLAVVPLV